MKLGLRALLATFAAPVLACSGSGVSIPGGGDADVADGSGEGGAGGDGAAPADAAKDSPAPIEFARHTIGFDDVAAGTTITTQYAAFATFSTDAGCALTTSTSAGVAASKPNYVWTYYSCQSGASASYFADFTKPVRHVSFALVGVNSTQKCATARLVHSDKSVTTTDVVGKGNYAVPVVVDLASSTDVVRLEIVDVSDPYGLGLDDVAFDFPK